jgi:hypothetical protein
LRGERYLGFNVVMTDPTRALEARTAGHHADIMMPGYDGCVLAELKRHLRRGISRWWCGSPWSSRNAVSACAADYLLADPGEDLGASIA